MAFFRLNSIPALTLVGIILFLPATSFSQDTIRVKLSIWDYSNVGSSSLDFSRIVLNKLIKPSDYIIIPVESGTEPIDLIGLCEIDLKTLPDGFIPSDILFKSTNVIISTKDRTIGSLREISEGKIGVISSSLAAEKIRQETQFFESYPTPHKLALDLLSEGIDYAIVEASIANFLLSRNTSSAKLYVANRNIFDSNLGFLVRTDNQKLKTYLNSRIESFKESKEAKEIGDRFLSLPRDYENLILMVGITVALALTLTLAFFGWKRGWFKRILTSYKVEMNGILMIRPSPSARTISSNDSNRQSFREKFSKLQTKYPSIQARLDFQHTAVKIEFRSINKTRVDGKEFLDTFAADLEDLLSAFAPEKYILELNITGECSNSFELNKFVFTNNGNKVGVMVTEFKNKFIL